jgi:ATP-dependent DNA helicase RecG
MWGKITNKEYIEINSVARPTATRDLAELVEKYRILANIGKGAGSYYKIIDSIES